MSGPPEISIEPLEASHWPRVRDIFVEGIESGNATFETEAPEWEVWDEGHLQACRYVAVDHGRVLGWSALSPVSDRCAYTGVGEVSVYVAADARGKGVGTRLMEALVEGSEALGYWTLQAGVFPENDASVRVHTRAGFRLVGRRSALGQMDGVWRDVLLLERRSETVGA